LVGQRGPAVGGAVVGPGEVLAELQSGLAGWVAVTGVPGGENFVEEEQRVVGADGDGEPGGVVVPHLGWECGDDGGAGAGGEDAAFRVVESVDVGGDAGVGEGVGERGRSGQCLVQGVGVVSGEELGRVGADGESEVVGVVAAGGEASSRALSIDYSAFSTMCQRKGSRRHTGSFILAFT
jgi:hypothetical protein